MQTRPPHPRGRRRWLPAILAPAVLLALVGPASALTVRLELGGQEIVLDGGDLERNSVRVTVGARFVNIAELRPEGPLLFNLSPLRCARAIDERTLSCARLVDADIRLVRGSLGALDDTIDVQGAIELAIALGAGDDRAVGGALDDDFDGGLGTDIIDGGAGVDDLSGGPGKDLITGGADPDRIAGDADEDVIRTNDGVRDTIFCGSPGGAFNRDDAVFADLKDEFPANDCEDVDRAPVNELPNVDIRDRPGATLVGRLLTARLACPAALRAACAGRLSAAPPRARAGVAVGAVRYRIAPGKTARVALRLSAAGAARLTALNRVRLTAVEPGSIGPKTTVAIIPVIVRS